MACNEMWTVKDVARMAGLHVCTVRKMLKDPQNRKILGAVKVGRGRGVWRFDPQAVELAFAVREEWEGR